jgi:glycosyltransferase involved in cell wall biosynthesis
MTLSIVIPVYNVASYLARCLDSVLVGNAFTGEVICVNDGSTDSSLDVLREYAQHYSNIRIINQPNAGLSAARNVGLDAASGDYIFFLDSDDFIFDGKLDEVLVKIDGEDVVYFNATRYFDASNTFEKVVALAEYRCLSGAAYFEAAERQKRNLPLVCVWGGLYKRTFLLQNHLYNETGIFHEDSYFTPQVLLRATSVSSVDVCLYAYRIRQGGITQSVSQKYIVDMLFICRNLYKLFRRECVQSAVFYNFVADYYHVTILEAYNNGLSMWRLWRLSDSVCMNRLANTDRLRKIARLSFVSPRLAYRYSVGKINSVVRRLVNRFL